MDAITQEDLDENIRLADRQMDRICSAFSKGFLSEEALTENVKEVFRQNFTAFLTDRCLRIRIAERDWDRVFMELQAWREDCLDEHLRVCSWLTFGTDSGLFKAGEEASLTDKKRVLTLMEYFHLPIGCFRPVPKGIITPDIHPAHFPSEYVLGYRIWGDSGELSPDDLKPGHTVTLTDHHGLKTQLQIDSPLLRDEFDRKGFMICTGTGTIEGYTTDRPREIRMTLRDGVVDYLQFFKGTDDHRLDFPLWRAYREDRAAVSALYDDAVRAVIDAHRMT